LNLPLDPYLSTDEARIYAIDLDEAIDLARPYLPSWIEIYATYVATGDRDLANEIYRAYKNPPDDERMEITLFLLFDVEETQRINETYTKEYYYEDDDDYYGISLIEFKALLLADLGEAFENAWDELTEWIDSKLRQFKNSLKEFLGFNIEVDHEWVGVVTRGYAYDYVLEQQYEIELEIEEVKNHTTDKEKWYGYDIHDWYTLWLLITVEYDEIITRYYHTLELDYSNFEEYEEGTRYQWVFDRIVDENDYKYTYDDVSMAIEVITAYLSEEYGYLGSAGGVKDFILAGDLNESIVNFATQFEGYKLADMERVDTFNTFWGAHWCAMFVTHCMRSAGVPIAFSSCTSFRAFCLRYDVPGFYDIGDRASFASISGYITSDRNQVATYNYIQPRRYIVI